ncbi:MULTISPECIES: ABC transporter permease [Caproicibacterium]|uniref:ABC transporter permease n=1 Tax=Caproicibacterium argilliputei TaxID=3030016 RepID=A0AA97H2X7_9FIRM|nr:ABC transporter permease [Caproicibacterium argilliputei]WOC33210.1 ABC transporter permease [Caproicibacterium argilliputei]
METKDQTAKVGTGADARSALRSFTDTPFFRTILPVLGLVIVVALFSILTQGRLIQPFNLQLLLSQTYVLMISSIGVFMIMTMGCLDFSQGSMMAIASIVICYLSKISLPLAVVGGILTGAAIGAINGFFLVKSKIASFIVTICTMFLFRGLCAYLTTNSPVYAANDIYLYNTPQVELTLTILALAVGFALFRFTPLGSNLKAIGAGETGARFAGVKVGKTKMLVFVAAGAITGFASLINVFKVGSVTSTGGNMMETQILIALVLGGMPISGGAKVSFLNIIVGVLTYYILATGLVMLGLTTEMQQLIEGIVFLIVVAIFSDRKSIQVIK